MPIRFVDPETGKDLRSTEFARATLATACITNRQLRENIAGAPDWRKWYLRLYADLAVEEGLSPSKLSQIASLGIQSFQSHLVTETGQPLLEAMSLGFSQDLVETAVIYGLDQAKPVAIDRHSGDLADTARSWAKDGLAEPGLISTFEYLDRNPNLELNQHLLFAVAGAAEFAPTQHWLRWGGQVAVVARNNPKTWEKLISLARSSGGTMLVPVIRQDKSKNLSEYSDAELAEVAGLDILEHFSEITSWMRKVQSQATGKFILGLYGYTPKQNHIRVQAVQEMLTEIATTNFPHDKLVFSWLATPTDSTPGPSEIGEDQLARFSKRAPLRILRDSLLGLFSAALVARPRFFTSDNGERLCLIDASVQQQGPSYSFSKRTQRWRAYLAHYAGIRVSYQISPPARTNSVLRHRILRASYLGAPLFGVKPFEVDVAKSASAAALVRDVFYERAYSNKETTCELQTFSAIHGGLWRLPYRPKSVWLAATILGLPALLKKGY